MDTQIVLPRPWRRPFIVGRTAIYATGCGLFVVLMILGAYVRIPLFFTPVPITLQTFFVLLAGAMLGRRWGAASQIIYLLLGATGLPVFQGYGAGIAHILGPTGGYLAGFMCAAYIVGYMLHEKEEKNLSKIIGSMAVGLAIIYVLGTAYLKMILGIRYPQALLLGFYPFLPGAVIKLVAASFVYKHIRNPLR